MTLLHLEKMTQAALLAAPLLLEVLQACLEQEPVAMTVILLVSRLLERLLDRLRASRLMRRLEEQLVASRSVESLVVPFPALEPAQTMETASRVVPVQAL